MNITKGCIISKKGIQDFLEYKGIIVFYNKNSIGKFSYDNFLFNSRINWKNLDSNINLSEIDFDESFFTLGKFLNIGNYVIWVKPIILNELNKDWNFEINTPIYKDIFTKVKYQLYFIEYKNIEFVENVSYETLIINNIDLLDYYNEIYNLKWFEKKEYKFHELMEEVNEKKQQLGFQLFETGIPVEVEFYKNARNKKTVRMNGFLRKKTIEFGNYKNLNMDNTLIVRIKALDSKVDLAFYKKRYKGVMNEHL